MLRVVADKLISDLMTERIDLYVNVSVCHQLTMLIIVVVFFQSVFEEKPEENIFICLT